MQAGYSKRTLKDKLGIKDNFSVYILNAPNTFEKILGPLPVTVKVKKEIENNLDYIHFFTKDESELISHFPKLRDALSKNGMLWLSWPKKTSKIETNLDGNSVRKIGLENGLVDIKVAAIDENWSGLKFVFRKKDR